MNQVATIEKPTRLEAFKEQVLPPERAKDLYSSLPTHVRREVFDRNLVNALMANPDLMQCDARLVFREVSKVAALGLLLDPQLGEAYLIAGWNGRQKRKEPQLRVGYRGLVKLARQSGEIKMIYAHEVHKNDQFECTLGDSKSLIHKPDLFGERGPIVGYYAVVKYDDGESDFEPMSVEQVHGIRDRSDGWKAFKAGRIKSTPWSTDEVEMAKKTVIRRLAKRIPQSPELAEAIKIEDAAEHSEMRAIAPPSPPSPPSPPPAPSAPLIEHDDNGEPDMPDHLKRDKNSAGAAAPAEQAAEPAEASSSGGNGVPEGSAADPSQPQDDELDPINPEKFYDDAEAEYAAATTRDDVNEVWARTVEPAIEDELIYFPHDKDRLDKQYKRHLERVGQ